MTFSPVLVFHSIAGAAGILSGAAAMIFRKGSLRHRQTGNVFVIAMLCLSASGAYLGFAKQQMLNGMMGVLTFYLVITAWLTARRRDGETGIFDWGVLMVPLAVGASLAVYGLAAARSQTGSRGGYPAMAYFIFGSVAALFAAGDVRMLVCGGVSGAQRVVRHLGRMCFALFIAAGSFFLGRQKIFPDFFGKMSVLLLLSFLPLVLMIYWLVRVRFTNAYKKKPVLPGADAFSLRT